MEKIPCLRHGNNDKLGGKLVCGMAEKRLHDELWRNGEVEVRTRVYI